MQNIGGGQIQYGPPNQIIGGAMAPLAPPIAPPMPYRLAYIISGRSTFGITSTHARHLTYLTVSEVTITKGNEYQ